MLILQVQAVYQQEVLPRLTRLQPVLAPSTKRTEDACSSLQQVGWRGSRHTAATNDRALMHCTNMGMGLGGFGG
jgi:hypothetical protein